MVKSHLLRGFSVVVFSYNRGRHLLNCVDSVHAHMPGVSIHIIDDASTDVETLEILDRLERTGLASVEKAPVLSERLLNGSLHQSIQRYVHATATHEFALLLQDDTQVVRSFGAGEQERVSAVFDRWRRAAFLLPLFLTHNSYEQEIDPLSWTDDDTVSFRLDFDYSGYFDICIANIQRLREVQFEFDNERSTSLRARVAFGPMRIMRRPFVAQLPLAPCFRYRERTLIQRICERGRVGLHPIDSVDLSVFESLAPRVGVLPTAERCLSSSAFSRIHPWPHTWHEDVFRVFTVAEQIEIRLRSLLL